MLIINDDIDSLNCNDIIYNKEFSEELNKVKENYNISINPSKLIVNISFNIKLNILNTIMCKPYEVPQIFMFELKEYIKEILNKNINKELITSYGIPCFVKHKPND
ncbi:hypothetical protein A0H76_2912 [Hepatospora eriocheir]|uniref:Reverse transcriptase domain-containing protein n=1 Tax=Hepatospora eriocheir TaxID=1081669 RepID=A0A1X0Q5M6_9MICR|nr:hypothetical protein A0H76_2912 [Hepatospora eriocheir]